MGMQYITCIMEMLWTWPTFSGKLFFQSDDGGEYKCVASNDAGTSEGVAYLIIGSSPTFKIAPPREVKVKLGREY